MTVPYPVRTYVVSPTEARLVLSNGAELPMPLSEAAAFDGMRWRGVHTTGARYQRSDAVRDGPWAMVATADTADKPAPVREGTLAWLAGLDTSPAWETISDTVEHKIVGIRWTPTEPFVLTRYRVWAMANEIVLPFVTIGRESDAPRFEPGIPVAIGDTGWVPFFTGEVIVPPGASVDFGAYIFPASPTTTTYSGSWDYRRNNSTSVPAGAAHHSHGGVLRIAHTDNEAVDQSATLALLATGDTITIAETVYRVVSSEVEGSVTAFTVTPTERAVDGIHEFTFEVSDPTATDHVRIVNGLTSVPDAKGIYGTGAYADLAESDDAYGVDVYIDELVVSPNWDVLAYSPIGGNGGTGGGSGGGTDPHDHDEDYLRLTGGTLTGPLTLPEIGAPSGAAGPQVVAVAKGTGGTFTTTFSVTVPLTAQEGDLLVGFCPVYGEGNSDGWVPSDLDGFATPAPLPSPSSHVGGFGTSYNGAMWHTKRCEAADIGRTVTWVFGDSGYHQMYLVVLRGVDTTADVAIVDGNYGSSSHTLAGGESTWPADGLVLGLYISVPWTGPGVTLGSCDLGTEVYRDQGTGDDYSQAITLHADVAAVAGPSPAVAWSGYSTNTSGTKDGTGLLWVKSAGGGGGSDPLLVVSDTDHQGNAITDVADGVADSDVATVGQLNTGLAGHDHDADYEPPGSVAAHEAAGDPHDQYLTEAEADAAYAPGKSASPVPTSVLGEMRGALVPTYGEAPSRRNFFLGIDNELFPWRDTCDVTVTASDGAIVSNERNLLDPTNVFMTIDPNGGAVGQTVEIEFTRGSAPLLPTRSHAYWSAFLHSRSGMPGVDVKLEIRGNDQTTWTTVLDYPTGGDYRLNDGNVYLSPDTQISTGQGGYPPSGLRITFTLDSSTTKRYIFEAGLFHENAAFGQNVFSYLDHDHTGDDLRPSSVHVDGGNLTVEGNGDTNSLLLQDGAALLAYEDPDSGGRVVGLWSEDTKSVLQASGFLDVEALGSDLTLKSGIGGNIVLDGKAVQNVGHPEADSDAVPRVYVTDRMPGESRLFLAADYTVVGTGWQTVPNMTLTVSDKFIAVVNISGDFYVPGGSQPNGTCYIGIYEDGNLMAQGTRPTGRLDIGYAGRALRNTVATTVTVSRTTTGSHTYQLGCGVADNPGGILLKKDGTSISIMYHPTP